MGPPEPDDTGPTPLNDHPAWSPPPGPAPWSASRRQPAQDAPAGELGEHLLRPCSTGSLAPGQLPCSPGGELGAGACAHTRRRCQRRPSSALDTRASDALPTLDHPFPARPDSGNDEQAAHRPQRHVEPGALDVACPPHRCIPDPAWCGQPGCRGRGHRTPVCPDTRIAPVAWTPDAWTPDVRPTSWLDGRPHDGQRTRTGRRPAWSASGHPGRPRRPRPPVGLPNLARVTASAALGHPWRRHGDDTYQRGSNRRTDWAAAQHRSA
jgi:hypothetical protein